MDVEFQNISYDAPCFKYKFWSTERKRILDKISGTFERNKLTALIGESGCGKTTLLDIICGYREEGVSGKILLNGCEFSSRSIIKQSCYVRQDDVSQPLLTVKESMLFVADLKLKRNLSKQQKKDVVLNIVKKFHLMKSLNTMTNNLSGGQKKRLAIALEMFSNPSIIALDEPVTGLDNLAAVQCLEIFKKLVSDGKTVICTIHQPSMKILTMFHNLYIMNKGQCIYSGSVDNILPFIRANNFECPTFYNPIEYILDLCILDDENNTHIFSKRIENGQSKTWLKSKSLKWNEELKNSITIEDDKISNLTSQKVKDFSYQFMCLLIRKWHIMSRDLLLTWLLLLSCIAEGVGNGLYFYNTGNDAQWIRFNFNLIYFTSMASMFNGLMGRIISHPLEINVIQREYFNQWYSMKAYWLSSHIGDIPVQVTSTFLMAIITYYLVGYPWELIRITKFVVPCIMISLISQDYGIILGTLFPMTTGLATGIFTMAPIVMFSGFFLQRNDCVHEICRSMFDTSYLHKGFQESLLAVYGDGRNELDCQEIFCNYKDPNVFLEEVDMLDGSDMFISNMIYLFTLLMFFKVISYVSLKYKLTRSK